MTNKVTWCWVWNELRIFFHNFNFLSQLLSIWTHTTVTSTTWYRHFPSPCDDKCDKRQAETRNSNWGLGFMVEPHVCSFSYTSFYCTIVYFDSTYGHCHHQQTFDDSWTTTTTSLTHQNDVATTTSTCRNTSITTTGRTVTHNGNKRGPRRPLLFCMFCKFCSYFSTY